MIARFFIIFAILQKRIMQYSRLSNLGQEVLTGQFKAILYALIATGGISGIVNSWDMIQEQDYDIKELAVTGLSIATIVMSYYLLRKLGGPVV